MNGGRLQELGLIAFLMAMVFVIVCCPSGDEKKHFNDEQTDDAECIQMVSEFYSTCKHALFDMSYDDAVYACKLGEPADVWPCIMDCWTEVEGDCINWCACIGDKHCLEPME